MYKNEFIGNTSRKIKNLSCDILLAFFPFPLSLFSSRYRDLVVASMAMVRPRWTWTRVDKFLIF